MFLSKRKCNGYYYLYYQNEIGKIQRITCKTKKKREAIKFLREFDIEKNSLIHSKRKMSDLRDEYIEYSKSVHSPKTHKDIKFAFSEFIRIIGDLQLVKVDIKSIEKFLSIRKEQSSIWAACRHYTILASALERAKAWNYIQDNPFRQVKKPKPPEILPAYFSKEDIGTLLNSIDNPDIKELTLFGLFSGMRLGEILQLKWIDVDLDRKVIFVKNSDTFRTKSGKIRVIPMNEELYRMLSLKRQSGHHADFVFHKNGKPYRDEYVSKTFKKHVRRSGINDRLHFHSLRHTFATWLVQQGTSLYEIQKLLGHQDIKTSMIYSHLQPETLHNTVNKLTI